MEFIVLSLYIIYICLTDIYTELHTSWVKKGGLWLPRQRTVLGSINPEAGGSAPPMIIGNRDPGLTAASQPPVFP